MSIIHKNYIIRELDDIAIPYKELEKLEPLLRDYFQYDLEILDVINKSVIDNSIAIALYKDNYAQLIQMPDWRKYLNPHNRLFNKSEISVKRAILNKKKMEIANQTNIPFEKVILELTSDEELIINQHAKEIVNFVEGLIARENQLLTTKDFDLYFRIPQADDFKSLFDENTQSLFYCLVPVLHLFFSLRYVETEDEKNKIERMHDEVSFDVHNNNIYSKKYYNKNVYPDLLRLYNLFKDYNPNNKKVIIRNNGKSLTLNNNENWITHALEEVLNKYKVDISIDVENEIERLHYKSMKSVGRKVSEPHQNILIRGIDLMWQHIFETKSNTNEKCELIARILNYVELPILGVFNNKFDDDTQMRYDSETFSRISARIVYLRKSEATEVWVEKVKTDLNGIDVNLDFDWGS